MSPGAGLEAIHVATRWTKSSFAVTIPASCNVINSGSCEGCEPFLRDAGDFENPFARLQFHGRATCLF